MTFESKVTLGNLIQIGSLLIVVLASYFSLQANQEKLALRVDQQVQTMQQIQTQYLRSDVQEARSAGVESQLRLMNQRLDRIEAAVK